jgi:hypothetical protein
MLYTPLTLDSDHAIIDAVGAVARACGVSRAQIALAWLRSKPVVTAPLVGANKTSQIDDAVASLDLELTPDGIDRLERPYRRAPVAGAKRGCHVVLVCSESPGDHGRGAEGFARGVGRCRRGGRWARTQSPLPILRASWQQVRGCGVCRQVVRLADRPL